MCSLRWNWNDLSLSALTPYLLTVTMLALGAARPSAAGQTQSPEMRTQESSPAFRIRRQRNLVVIRAVVRDSKGRLVTNFHKEDFRVTDNRKPQEITQFSLETPGAPPAAHVKPTTPEIPSPPVEASQALPEAVPQRFLLLFFDDLNTPFADLAQGRDAAGRFLASGLAPTDRVGIFTASGLNTVEFTEDRATLRAGLLKLRPNSPVHPGADCPEISDYLAEQIVHLQDRDAIAVAVDEAIKRCDVDPRSVEQHVRMLAQRALGEYEMQAGWFSRVWRAPSAAWLARRANAT